MMSGGHSLSVGVGDPVAHKSIQTVRTSLDGTAPQKEVEKVKAADKDSFLDFIPAFLRRK
jgi:hypothetical protein